MKLTYIATAVILFSCAGASSANAQREVAVVNHNYFKAIMDCSTRLPLAVVYRLDKDQGNASRVSSYMADPVLMEKAPHCHPKLDHSFKTYQSVATKLGVEEKFDVGHLAMANHLDANNKSVYVANYFSNLAPQSAEMNRTLGAWYASEAVVECHRDIEPLLVFAGTIDDPKDTSRDYFIDTFGQPTPEYFWRVIYFEHSNAYAAWIMPNRPDAKKAQFERGDYNVTLETIIKSVRFNIPEIVTLIERKTPQAPSNFVSTKTSGQWLTCRNNRSNIG